MVDSGFGIGEYTTQDKVRLNSFGGKGINLRNDKCQKITTLPNGTYSENFPQKSVRYSNGIQHNMQNWWRILFYDSVCSQKRDLRCCQSIR